MHVDDVRPERHVDRDRNAEPGAGGQQADLAMGELSLVAVNVMADRLADPLSFFSSPRNCFVQHAAGFLCHPEATGVDLCLYVF